MRRRSKDVGWYIECLRDEKQNRARREKERGKEEREEKKRERRTKKRSKTNSVVRGYEISSQKQKRAQQNNTRLIDHPKQNPKRKKQKKNSNVPISRKRFKFNWTEPHKFNTCKRFPTIFVIVDSSAVCVRRVPARLSDVKRVHFSSTFSIPFIVSFGSWNNDRRWSRVNDIFDMDSCVIHALRNKGLWLVRELLPSPSTLLNWRTLGEQSKSIRDASDAWIVGFETTTCRASNLVPHTRRRPNGSRRWPTGKHSTTPIKKFSKSVAISEEMRSRVKFLTTKFKLLTRVGQSRCFIRSSVPCVHHSLLFSSIVMELTRTHFSKRIASPSCSSLEACCFVTFS